MSEVVYPVQGGTIHVRVEKVTSANLHREGRWLWHWSATRHQPVERSRSGWALGRRHARRRSERALAALA